MRKIQFLNDYFYHVYNRGTEKREIFLEERDYYRFIRGLYGFNDENSMVNLSRKIERGLASHSRRRELLVEILSFCLMPNHFHLLLRQKRDRGITNFMQKLGTGYSMYFNQKYQREGRLFQGPFKAILVDKDSYLVYLLNYIHLNPVELIKPNWKEKGIKDWGGISQFLGKYRWSSYLDYIGKHNFPSIINKNFMNHYFNQEEYKTFINRWVLKDLEKIKNLSLEL